MFVFLLSKTGNSMAIWRRKITIPRDLRVAYGRDVHDVKAALHKEAIHVDQCVCCSVSALTASLTWILPAVYRRRRLRSPPSLKQQNRASWSNQGKRKSPKRRKDSCAGSSGSKTVYSPVHCSPLLCYLLLAALLSRVWMISPPSAFCSAFSYVHNLLLCIFAATDCYN